MRTLRIVLVLAALAVACVGIAVALTSSYTDQSEAIDAARARGELNEDSAESAPQQQVVNGWLAADLLEIQAQQLNDIGESQSTTNLMLGLIGAVAALGFLAVALQSKAADVVMKESPQGAPSEVVALPAAAIRPDADVRPTGESPSSMPPPSLA